MDLLPITFCLCSQDAWDSSYFTRPGESKSAMGHLDPYILGLVPSWEKPNTIL